MSKLELGNYHNIKSIIHQLNPRIKILVILIVIISCIFAKNYIYLSVCLAVVFVGYIMAKIPVHKALSGTRGLIIIIAMIALINALFRGGQVVFEWLNFRLTIEGINMGVRILIKSVVFIWGISLVNFTTTNAELVEGFEFVLGFLRIFGINVKVVSIFVAVWLGFPQAVARESRKIVRSREIRGIFSREERIDVRVKLELMRLRDSLAGAYGRMGTMREEMRYKIGENESGRRMR
ncbi:MAG: hypothetical protein K6G63_02955 [Eubacterium sp.]|nr:hypothetical protein [Eubacterium sp.]